MTPLAPSPQIPTTANSTSGAIIMTKQRMPRKRKPLKHVSQPAFFQTLYGPLMAPIAQNYPYDAAHRAFVAGMITAEQAAAHVASDRQFIATFEVDFSSQ